MENKGLNPLCSEMMCRDYSPAGILLLNIEQNNRIKDKTYFLLTHLKCKEKNKKKRKGIAKSPVTLLCIIINHRYKLKLNHSLQKGGIPAAPSGTATLLRLSPSYQFYPRTLLNGYVLQVPPASMA